MSFPEAEEAPETNRHLEIRTTLYLTLKRELARVATLGSNQFVYWDPTTSKKRLAPDAFVRLGTPHRPFPTWKIWERGAPELGVEIVNDFDEGEPHWNGSEPDWSEELERYRASGIREVVRFHPDDRDNPIRIWDAVDGDLVERAPSDPALHACETLGLWWVVVEDNLVGPMLRLARDRDGHDLLSTPDEAAAKARAVAAKAREAEAKAREAEAKAREAEAKAHGTNKQLQAKIEALQAALKKAKGKPQKRR